MRDLVAERGVPPLVAMLREKLHDETTALEGARALLGLTFEPHTQQKLIEGGGTAALADLLRAHSRHADIVAVCVIAFQHLTTQRASGNALLACGAVEALLAAVQVHASDVAIMVPAWRALANLLLMPEMVTAVLDAGGLDAAVQACEAAVDAPVHEAVCLAIASVAEASADTLVEDGGLEAILRAIKLHGTSADERAPHAVSNALLAVQRMCAYSNVGPGRASEHGAANLVFKAMAHFPEELEVQARACMALWAMFNVADNVLDGESCGALGAIVAAMAAFPTSADVQLWGCNALARATLAAPTAVLRVGGHKACAAALQADSDGEFPPEFSEPMRVSGRLVADTGGIQVP